MLTWILVENCSMSELASPILASNGNSAWTTTSFCVIVTSDFNVEASISYPTLSRSAKLLRHWLTFLSTYLSICFSIEFSLFLSSGLLEEKIQSEAQLFGDFR